MALIRLNGQYVLYQGKLATDPDLCDCACGENLDGCLLPPDVSNTLNFVLSSSNPVLDGLSGQLVWEIPGFWGPGSWAWFDDDDNLCEDEYGDPYAGINIYLYCNKDYPIDPPPSAPWNTYMAAISASMFTPIGGFVTSYSEPTVTINPLKFTGSWDIQIRGGDCGGDATVTYEITEA